MLWTGALRIKASDIVMAGLNARGLQSKLLITPLSSEAIIGASLSEPHLVRTMIFAVCIYRTYGLLVPGGAPRKCATRKRMAGRIRVRGHTHGRHNREETK